MKNAIIFLHGNLSDTSSIRNFLSEDSLILCADGGAEHARKIGLVPDVVIGDFDSISQSDRVLLEEKEVTCISYPREKDYTDAELAVRYAVDQGADEIIITGLLGDRIDHMTANMFFLAELSGEKHIRIIEKDQDISFVDRVIEIAGKKGDEISLIPIKSDCRGITTEGLYYPLSDASLPLGSTRGISNVMLSHKAKVTVTQGVLMVVHRRMRY